MANKIEIRAVLEYFRKVVFNGDMLKLIDVSRGGKKVERELLDRYMATPTINDTFTTRDVTNPYLDFDPRTARCAVPMAMSLFATINFIGYLIEPKNANNFEQKLKAFLEYADKQFPMEEQKVLSSIYRNGMMHGFFPKGSGIQIEFDPDSKSTECLVCSYDIVILDVMALYRLVTDVFNKITNSAENLSVMQANLNRMIDVDIDTPRIIQALKELRSSRPNTNQ